MAEAPQFCPAPKCRASLKDSSVPYQYRKYKKLFTLALVDLEAPVRKDQTAWQCPVCDHRWYGSGNFMEYPIPKTIV